jgi:hypothetical protein
VENALSLVQEVAKIAISERDKGKVIGHLKAASKWTRDVAGKLDREARLAATKQSM